MELQNKNTIKPKVNSHLHLVRGDDVHLNLKEVCAELEAFARCIWDLLWFSCGHITSYLFHLFLNSFSCSHSSA